MAIWSLQRIATKFDKFYIESPRLFIDLHEIITIVSRKDLLLIPGLVFNAIFIEFRINIGKYRVPRYHKNRVPRYHKYRG